MSIIVTEGTSFTPHPEGQFRAVCVDVVERHNVATAWGPKNKVRIAWQTEELRDDGKPCLASASFNANLSENGRLRPFLEAWRGRKFTAQELRGFDLENLIGVQAVIQITHTERDGKTYDNVTAIMRPMKGVPPLEPRDYVRVQDREQDEQSRRGGGHHSASSGDAPAGGRSPSRASFDDFPPELEAEEDDLPF